MLKLSRKAGVFLINVISCVDDIRRMRGKGIVGKGIFDLYRWRTGNELESGETKFFLPGHMCSQRQ